MATRSPSTSTPSPVRTCAPWRWSPATRTPSPTCRHRGPRDGHVANEPFDPRTPIPSTRRFRPR
ncbi:MAG: hypothetical protein ACLU37_02265 [Collinsella sp.]